MNVSIIERRLKHDHKLPDDFHFCRWECFPKSQATIYVELSGGQCPLKTRGPRKGKPNYSKATNRRTFVVTVEQAAQWEQEYADETGNCIVCMGSGQEIAKIDFVNKVTEYRDCRKCGGSGKARLLTDTTTPIRTTDE